MAVRRWDESGATPSHAYTGGARDTATLTVTDDAGATGVVSMSVYANAPPSASFTVTCDGPRCSVDGTGTSDPDGTITTYVWIFGDGTSGPGPTMTHTYTTGTFSNYSWSFGDGTTSPWGAPAASHAYAAAGTYTSR